ncbi:hypothetical protein C8J56DRAFT_959758 [Mycena floridula]|nr:hypothetical protein C8J56DRAFT_959758 [Mycena floridula]
MGLLPLELLLEIVSQLDHGNDLLNMRAVSSSLCTLVTPIAFRSIRIKSRLAAAKGLTELKSSVLAKHVHHVEFCDDGLYETERSSHVEETLLLNALSTAFSDISSFTDLERMTLNFFDFAGGERDAGSRPLPLQVQWDVIGAVTGQQLPSGLRSMAFFNLFCLHNPRIYSNPLFHAILGRLEELEISVVSSIFKAEDSVVDDISDFWIGGLGYEMLVHSGALTSLTITNIPRPLDGVADIGVGFPKPTFPHLTKLTLVGTPVAVEGVAMTRLVELNFIQDNEEAYINESGLIYCSDVTDSDDKAALIQFQETIAKRRSRIVPML